LCADDLAAFEQRDVLRLTDGSRSTGSTWPIDGCPRRPYGTSTDRLGGCPRSSTWPR